MKKKMLKGIFVQERAEERGVWRSRAKDIKFVVAFECPLLLLRLGRMRCDKKRLCIFAGMGDPSCPALHRVHV